MRHTNVIARWDGFIAVIFHSTYDFKRRAWIFDGSTHSFCAVKPISIDFLEPYSTAPPTPSGSKKRTFLSFTTVHKWRAEQCVISLPRRTIVVDETPQLRINKPPTPPEKIHVISVSTVRRNRTQKPNAFFLVQWHQLHPRILGKKLRNRFCFFAELRILVLGKNRKGYVSPFHRPRKPLGRVKV
jgi:hypothetical protein